MPDWLYQLGIILAIFGAIIFVGYLAVHFLGKMLLALLIEKGVEIAAEHGPGIARKVRSAMWRRVYKWLPGWAQRRLPTPKASTPRTSGPTPTGGIVTAGPPTGPAGAPTPTGTPAGTGAPIDPALATPAHPKIWEMPGVRKLGIVIAVALVYVLTIAGLNRLMGTGSMLLLFEFIQLIEVVAITIWLLRKNGGTPT